MNFSKFSELHEDKPCSNPVKICFWEDLKNICLKNILYQEQVLNPDINLMLIKRFKLKICTGNMSTLTTMCATNSKREYKIDTLNFSGHAVDKTKIM